MEQYTCTCHCGGAVFYRHLHASSCPLSQHGDEAPLTELESLRASLAACEAERDSFRELAQGQVQSCARHCAEQAQAEARVQALEQENARLKEATYPAIHLVREGYYAVVRIEVDGHWIELIREHYDAPFSHIIEPSGIQARIEKHALEGG